MCILQRRNLQGQKQAASWIKKSVAHERVGGRWGMLTKLKQCQRKHWQEGAANINLRQELMAWGQLASFVLSKHPHCQSSSAAIRTSSFTSLYISSSSHFIAFVSFKKERKKSTHELRGKTQTLTIHFSLRTAWNKLAFSTIRCRKKHWGKIHLL